MAIRIGVDVGGTFTDAVCFDEESKKLALLKLLSTPHEPSEAVLAGTQRTLHEQHIDPKAVSFFIHGTTIATNALLERKGCRVALLVTEAFRHVPQIMRQDRPRLYDYFARRPQPLVPRHLRFETQERMLHTGQVQRPLCTNSLATVLEKIRQERNDQRYILNCRRDDGGFDPHFLFDEHQSTGGGATPQEAGENAKRMIEKYGYTALKMGIVAPGDMPQNQALRLSTEHVRAVRESGSGYRYRGRCSH